MVMRLPSLSALRAFEAAARLRSFKKAAEELAVTGTAISHRIRVLEEYLGYDRDEGKTYTYPLEVNVLKGLKNHHF